MVFLSVAHSDVGIKKSTNQDSVLIKEAVTDYGNVLLSVVCDGMGGLAKGEVASATLIRAFSRWFDEELPFLLYQESGITYDDLMKSWSGLIDTVNIKIANYADGYHTTCGTTLVALLLIGGRYYLVNVGDSRVYHIGSTFKQLTKDQTFVQREMDEGRMTPEEAKVHPQRNVLLQCVGAGMAIIPDYLAGDYKDGEMFMMCSDGFRHVITEDEFRKIIVPEKMASEKDLRDAAFYCTELNKQRKETDNITSVLIKVN